jgi:hypothetical protein
MNGMPVSPEQPGVFWQWFMAPAAAAVMAIQQIAMVDRQTALRRTTRGKLILAAMVYLPSSVVDDDGRHMP